MDNFLGRLIAIVICVPLAMHGIGYGIEINGGAHRWNPAWILLQGYFEFEIGVVEVVGTLLGIAFVVWLVITLGNKWMDQKEEERKAALDEGKKLAAKMKSEAYQKEKEDREYYEEQLELKKRTLMQAQPSPAPVAESPQIKTITPDELKRRAIEQFKKGI